MDTFYHSTRNGDDSVTSKQAILAGIAPDGGLFVSDGLGAEKIDLALVVGQDYHATARLVLGTLLATSARARWGPASRVHTPTTSTARR